MISASTTVAGLTSLKSLFKRCSWISTVASLFFLASVLSSLLPNLALSQDDQDIDLSSIAIPEARLPLCFGFSDIRDTRALAVCDALNLKENVRARELSESWLREAPDSPGAQFALAEILFTVEGNMPRALYHLNLAEELTGYESMEQAVNSGNVQWHYLTLSQLSYVHQLMGDQLMSLEYLDKINQIYGQDIESFRGWPLIKLKEYDAARDSANRVLQSSDDERARARAWNTLCAVELASLQPVESMSACERAISEDESIASSGDSTDTVYLSNASEVALSLLEMEQAEEYLDRATRYLNPDSVADPWIYKLYLTMNQGRFDEARNSLDRMLIWRQQQEPIVSVMNRAEHFLVSAGFLLLAGYAEDAAKLTATALNQPDRTGSYSADDAQKDSYAALINMMANDTLYQIQLENIATMDWLEANQARINALSLRFNAWRSGSRAAALFASQEVLMNRLRPYAPLDVHIPEWIEPELVGLLGTGVIASVLDETNATGAFQLNAGYYHAYSSEIAAQDNNSQAVIDAGSQALSLLPPQEVLLRARIAANMALAFWRSGQFEEALLSYETAFKQDPSIIRRLGASLPVNLDGDGSEFSNIVTRYLARSPRFESEANGLILEVASEPDLSICLKNRNGEALSCYTMSADANQDSKWNAQQLTREFHSNAFGLGYDISKAQRSILLGSSVILSSQNNSNSRQNTDALLDL